VGNRRAWDRALEAEERRRRRYGGTASIIVVDVDGLKNINDTQGHLGGDLLLRMVASTIDTTSRDSDLVARIGGDEFGVLALDCDEPHLRILNNRIRRALETQGIEASVGGATRRPGAGMEEAWAEADAAMYQDKARRGRGPAPATPGEDTLGS
jgi:diguanylate cyclase